MPLEYFSAERCYVTELYNNPLDSTVSVARIRVEPGVSTCWHRLTGISERYLLLSGQGLLELGEHPPRLLLEGDHALIEPDQAQRITNTGDSDLEFLVICTPRFQLAAYQDLEAPNESITSAAPQ